MQVYTKEGWGKKGLVPKNGCIVIHTVGIVQVSEYPVHAGVYITHSLCKK